MASWEEFAAVAPRIAEVFARRHASRGRTGRAGSGHERHP
jgi:hypothetical protein